MPDRIVSPERVKMETDGPPNLFRLFSSITRPGEGRFRSYWVTDGQIPCQHQNTISVIGFKDYSHFRMYVGYYCIGIRETGTSPIIPVTRYYFN